MDIYVRWDSRRLLSVMSFKHCKVKI